MLVLLIIVLLSEKSSRWRPAVSSLNPKSCKARRRFVLTRLSREAGCPVDQTTTVLDLSGMGMKHMSKDALTYTRRISDIFQDNYSGMTTSLLVVNTPWVFSTGWQMIQGESGGRGGGGGEVSLVLLSSAIGLFADCASSRGRSKVVAINTHCSNCTRCHSARRVEVFMWRSAGETDRFTEYN